MATNARNRRLEPAYKQHTAVDDKVGVILDVAVTTGQTNEGEMIEPQVDEVKASTGIAIKTTADVGYSYAKVYGALERRRIYASRHQFGPFGLMQPMYRCLSHAGRSRPPRTSE
jgi:Transposase DDE domain